MQPFRFIRGLLGLAALAMAGSSMAATLNATPTSLDAQLGAAKPGDTLVVGPGVYSPWIQGKNFSPPVTVTGEGAVLTGLTVRASDGLNFSGLELAADCPTAKDPFVVQGSRNIRFEDLRVSGKGACRNGLLIRDSEGITVSRSAFTGTINGLTHLNVTGLTITDSHFHRLVSDGIAGGCTSRLTITGNRMHDFRPTPGTHGDGVQLWMVNCKADVSDILIADNLIYRGEGGVETVAQGIFITGGPLRYHRLTVRGNTVLGGMYNGITVAGGGQGSVVEDNTVLGFPDMQNWIRAADNIDLTIRRNRTQSLQFPNGQAGVKLAENVSQSPLTDRGAALLAALDLGKAPAPKPDLAASLAVRTGAKLEPLKTKGRLIIDFKTPEQAATALAALPKF